MSKKTIQITPHYQIIIDEIDVRRVETKVWHAVGSRTSGIYFVTNIRSKNGRTTQTLASFILKSSQQKPVRFKKKHAIFDYTRDNLVSTDRKILSQTQSSKRKKASSIFRGVSWSQSSKMWRAVIRNKDRLNHLGYFRSEEEAAIAYNVAARELFGPHAHQNKFKSECES